MKVWLDDERPVPSGWVGCRTPQEAIRLLKTDRVIEISLDHDLGLIGDDREETGYDVLIWIEREVVVNDFLPPEMFVHSANPVARRKMELAITSISTLRDSNTSTKGEKA